MRARASSIPRRLKLGLSSGRAPLLVEEVELDPAAGDVGEAIREVVPDGVQRVELSVGDATMALTYPDGVLTEDFVRGLAGAWCAALARLAEQPGGHTPSDLGLLTLSQDQIDELPVRFVVGAAMQAFEVELAQGQVGVARGEEPVAPSEAPERERTAVQGHRLRAHDRRESRRRRRLGGALGDRRDLHGPGA